MAQDYMNRLEFWMNLWRLQLAPHKCAQITFSKARCIAEDVMCLKLYGVQIPCDQSPKFLGIVFDPRLSFDKHLEHFDKKILDRINILKILSYYKNWRLSTTILVRMYKVLLRSVLDYACVTTVACLE